MKPILEKIVDSTITRHVNLDWDEKIKVMSRLLHKTFTYSMQFISSPSHNNMVFPGDCIKNPDQFQKNEVDSVIKEWGLGKHMNEHWIVRTSQVLIERFIFCGKFYVKGRTNAITYNLRCVLRALGGELSMYVKRYEYPMSRWNDVRNFLIFITSNQIRCDISEFCKIYVCIMNQRIYFLGDAFKLKDELKSLGSILDCVKKSWYMEDSDENRKTIRSTKWLKEYTHPYILTYDVPKTTISPSRKRKSRDPYVCVEIKNGEIYFKGDTYEVRDKLKSIGAQWNSREKMWSMCDTQDAREMMQTLGFLNYTK
jgi:hypothetical protein